MHKNGRRDERHREPARNGIVSTKREWFHEAVFYEVRVRSFRDGNGDGIGDFRGLTEGLGHLEALGVNALWLMPTFPSPLVDDGYDVADYCGVHPDLGTLADFDAFLAAAHARGIRVILDLVLNHTSAERVVPESCSRARQSASACGARRQAPRRRT
jgi:maltose alpha-D-glucosyltransferase/alpha-amylase